MPGANDVYRLAYQGAANDAADEYGVPRAIFAALVTQESGWNISASGSAGEIGLTQLKPGTAKEVGANPYDPISNLRGGAAYLAKQYTAFGSWENALAAYNQGPGTAGAVLAGQPSTSQSSAWTKGKQYATSVLSIAQNEYGYGATDTGQPSDLGPLEDLKVFGVSPADIFRWAVGLPSQAVKETVGNVPGVGNVVQGATDALTGQSDLLAQIFTAEFWRSSALYILLFVFLAALVLFSASSLLKG